MRRSGDMKGRMKTLNVFERVNFGKSLYYSITYKNKFDIDSLIPFEAKLLQTAHFALKFLTNPHPLSRKVAGWETINV
jgi:hypothetical protein